MKKAYAIACFVLLIVYFVNLVFLTSSGFLFYAVNNVIVFGLMSVFNLSANKSIEKRYENHKRIFYALNSASFIFVMLTFLTTYLSSRHTASEAMRILYGFNIFLFLFFNYFMHKKTHPAAVSY